MKRNNESGCLLLLDDEVAFRRSLADMLRGEGFCVFEASNLDEARAILRHEKIELALLDYMLKSGHEGIELLQSPEYPMPPVVMISNKSGVCEAARAMQLGALDFLDKDDGDAERILLVIKNTIRLGKLLRQKIKQYPLIGSSPAMQRLRELTLRWARSPANVLILGESGSGKEAIARALHYQGPRAFEPFVVVNCPSIPDHLLESELFGHVKGAFTGAYRDHRGAFQRARGGTLYFAEVGDLSAVLQSKLLHVISEGEACQIGSEDPYEVEMRIVAATNRDHQQVLRPDFHQRIAEGVLEVPPLRERREDIPEIVHYWLERLGAEERRVRTISPDAVKLLQEAEWKGNVRELIRFLRNLLVLGEDGTDICEDEVRRNLYGDALATSNLFDPDLSYAEAHARFNRELLARRLMLFKGKKQEVARSLGISRTTLYEKLQMCGFE